ncbi:prepilin-type N-terminal cleavage/methylation domain-containing protein [Enterovibrio coralii]
MANQKMTLRTKTLHSGMTMIEVLIALLSSVLSQRLRCLR